MEAARKSPPGRYKHTMSAPRVFVGRALPGEALPRLADVAEIDIWPERLPPTPEALRGRVASCDGLIALLTDRVDADLLDAAPALRVVANVAVGYDNIDVPACTARGIPVGNTPGVLTESTADLAFALILAAARRVVEAAEAVKAGAWVTWEPEFMAGVDVHGATLGIVGMGAIGSAVAARAAGFQMRVLHTSRSGGVPLPELLAEADFVSVHCPLNDDTRGLIGEPELRLMKRTAILVNSARGPIVDQEALTRALREGWIAAAGLDVTAVEPIPIDDPLLALPNCVVLPHIGSATIATRSRMASMAVDNVLAAFAGDRLPTCVNPDVYSGRASA